MKIALLGNCQVDPIRHMLILASPGLEITPFNVNNMRNEKDQLNTFQKLKEFDYVVTQVLGENYRALSSKNIRTRYSNSILIPNLFFLGWHPDMTYLGDGTSRVLGPSEDLHSLICVLLVRAIPNTVLELDNEKVVNLYENGFRKLMEIHKPFDTSKNILKKRFSESDLSFELFDQIVGFQEPFMFTHNHPMNRAILGIVKQVLDKIMVSPMFVNSELINFSPNPLANRVTWSPISPYMDSSEIDLKNRTYYVGKGRFLNNSQFVSGEIAALTKIKQIPSIRRPDIPDIVFERLIEYFVDLTR